MTRLTLVTLAVIACLCVYECHGRKQRPVVADSLVSEDTALVQPHDSAPDETSGVAPGEKKQPLSVSPASASVAEAASTTKSPKGKNGKRGKNGNGGGKKVKKNRNSQQPSNGSSGEGKRKNKNKSATASSDVTLSTSRGKKNKSQGRTTSSVPSADTTVE